MEISLLRLKAARFGGGDRDKNEPILTDETGTGRTEEMTLLVKEFAVKHKDPVSDPLLSHKMLGGRGGTYNPNTEEVETRGSFVIGGCFFTSQGHSDPNNHTKLY